MKKEDNGPTNIKIECKATDKQNGKKQEKLRGKETVNQQDKNVSKTPCQLSTVEPSVIRRKQPRHKTAESCHSSIKITKRQNTNYSKQAKKQNANVTDADNNPCGTCGDVIVDAIAGRQWLQCQQPNCGNWYLDGCQGLEESNKQDIFSVLHMKIVTLSSPVRNVVKTLSSLQRRLLLFSSGCLVPRFFNMNCA